MTITVQPGAEPPDLKGLYLTTPRAIQTCRCGILPMFLALHYQAVLVVDLDLRMYLRSHWTFERLKCYVLNGESLSEASDSPLSTSRLFFKARANRRSLSACAAEMVSYH